MRIFAFLGAINAALAVAAGAFAAHGLRERLEPRALEIFETGARYHMVHALGLFAVAWLVARGAPASRVAGWVMLGGIAIFSGSLYLLALTDVRALGAITPIGGLGFLIAWGLAAYGALRMPDRRLDDAG